MINVLIHIVPITVDKMLEFAYHFVYFNIGFFQLLNLGIHCFAANIRKLRYEFRDLNWELLEKFGLNFKLQFALNNLNINRENFPVEVEVPDIL